MCVCVCVCVQQSVKGSHGLDLSYWVLTRCQAPRTLLCFISFYNSSYNNWNEMDITIPIKEMKKNWKNLPKFSNFIKTKTKTKTHFMRVRAGLELAAVTTAGGSCAWLSFLRTRESCELTTWYLFFFHSCLIWRKSHMCLSKQLSKLKILQGHFFLF